MTAVITFLDPARLRFKAGNDLRRPELNLRRYSSSSMARRMPEDRISGRNRYRVCSAAGRMGGRWVRPGAEVSGTVCEAA